MDLYKVLLVDDEEEVREAIAAKLDWQSLGFTVVGEAGHGEQALEMAEALQPDVIMTDIRMPFMDGLTLGRRAKALLPGVKIAIFSGYDEFEYAKEAIRLEVEEYILKPIDAGELAEVFRRIRENLDREIARARDMELLRKRYEQSLPLLRQQVMTDILEGRIEAGAIEARLAEYDIHIGADSYAVALVQMDPGEDGESARLLRYSLEPLVAERLGGSLPYLYLQFYDAVVLLFTLPAEASARRVANALDGLFPLAKKRLGVNLSIGLGNLYPALVDIAASHAEAREALAHQPLMEGGQCIFIGDVLPGGTAPEALDPSLIEDILRQIKLGGREELEAAVGRLAARLRGTRTGRQQYQALMLALSGELFRLIKSYRLEGEDGALTGELLEKNNADFAGLEELCHWLAGFCERMRSGIRRERKDSTRALVESAKAYIDEHFADSGLSADTVCGVLNLSPAYFSTLFKRETGESFVAYLTRLRMEKALEYLNNTDDKTYLIADRVGYTDPNYFSYVFKKFYGTAPSKYRTGRGMENGTAAH